MRAAQELPQRLLPDYPSKFSRKDYTLPQGFACLVLREHQKKSYRGVETLLRDCPDWRDEIALKDTPDHNTLCHAFKHLVRRGLMNRMLDLRVKEAKLRGMIQGPVKPAAIDSSLFESHHVSRPFEKRCRKTARQDRNTQRNTEANRRIAPLHLGVRSIIPPKAGRPSRKPPPTRYRRPMYHRFKRKADEKLYRQRWQAETVNRRIKRNLGSALRARTARRGSMELLLRVITHNRMSLTKAEG